MGIRLSLKTKLKSKPKGNIIDLSFILVAVWSPTLDKDLVDKNYHDSHDVSYSISIRYQQIKPDTNL